MKIKVSLVSYLNTLPFLYGIQNSDVIEQIDLQLDIPSVCAQKLITNQVDLGLVPVAIIPQLKEHYIVSDYCIGAKGKVNSVLLVSDVPLNEIKEVLLDYQSRTSVTLVKVLAQKLWQISPEWKQSKEGFENSIEGNTAGVIIGDRTFNLPKNFKYKYDLAEEWEKLTELPFTFACWVANKKLPEQFIKKLNKALKNGIEQTEKAIQLIGNRDVGQQELLNYLKNDIDYQFDNPKKQATKLFLDYLVDI